MNRRCVAAENDLGRMVMLLTSPFRSRLIGAALLALLTTGSASAASADLDVVKVRDNVYMGRCRTPQ